MALDPRTAYLTHFGRLADPQQLAPGLHALIDDLVRIARATTGQGESRHRRLKSVIEALLLERLGEHGCRLDEARLRALLANDVELNAQGLAVWLDGGQGR
jgi:hypothetical protein